MVRALGLLAVVVMAAWIVWMLWSFSAELGRAFGTMLP